MMNCLVLLTESVATQAPGRTRQRIPHVGRVAGFGTALDFPYGVDRDTAAAEFDRETGAIM